MDKQLARIQIRAVEAALKVITEALDRDFRETALKALVEIEQELAALRQMLEGNEDLEALDQLDKMHPD
jgi:hypothetical protein